MDRSEIISRKIFLQSCVTQNIAEVIDMLSDINEEQGPWLVYKDLEEVSERLRSIKEFNLRALEVHHILTCETGAHDQ